MDGENCTFFYLIFLLENVLFTFYLQYKHNIHTEKSYSTSPLWTHFFDLYKTQLVKIKTPPPEPKYLNQETRKTYKTHTNHNHTFFSVG